MAEAALWFLGLVGTGLVFRGCTRAQGAVCGVLEAVCVRHVDTRVCLCTWGVHFRMKWCVSTGHKDKGYICQGRGVCLS